MEFSSKAHVRGFKLASLNIASLIKYIDELGLGILLVNCPVDILSINEVIYEQRERVFHRDIQTRENNV
jgi:hypothetical protein